MAAPPRRRINAAAVQPYEEPAPPPRPAGRRTTTVQGRGSVSSTVKDRTSTYYENDTDYDLLKVEFSQEDPPAEVSMAAGLTLNLGNFESLRIDCRVTIPCRREDIVAAQQVAADFVAERISEEQTNWLGSHGKHQGKAG